MSIGDADMGSIAINILGEGSCSECDVKFSDSPRIIYHCMLQHQILTGHDVWGGEFELALHRAQHEAIVEVVLELDW